METETLEQWYRRRLQKEQRFLSAVIDEVVTLLTRHGISQDAILDMLERARRKADEDQLPRHFLPHG